MRDDYIRLQNNSITLFTRNLKSGNVYYARYRITKRNLADGQRYITESLKTLDETEAIYKSQERYLEIKFKEKTSQAIKGKFVRDAIHDFLNDYQNRLNSSHPNETTRKGRYTSGMLRIYKRTIERYWLEYCGHLELSMINYETFEKYEGWRRTYYKRSKDEGKIIHPGSKDDISDSTLQLEYNSMKSLMRWAHSKKYYYGNDINFKFTSIKNKRRAFTPTQMRKLNNYMRRNEYLNKGKHGNDPLIRRSRNQFRSYVLFMTNVGCRSGESRYLKWKDIEYRHTDDGKKYIEVSIRSDTKTRKGRVAIGRHSAQRALERLRKSRTDNLEKDDYIFCRVNGEPIQHFRDIFNTVIKEADVEFDTDGNKHTVYTLRHYYITSRLRHTKNLNLIALAKNCGTSVSMIETYYDDSIPLDYVDKLI